MRDETGDDSREPRLRRVPLAKMPATRQHDPARSLGISSVGGGVVGLGCSAVIVTGVPCELVTQGEVPVPIGQLRRAGGLGSPGGAEPRVQ
jgi:hypothetical protein